MKTDELKAKFIEIASRYVDGGKEVNDLVSELLACPEIIEEYNALMEVKSRREQILDINQWSSLLLNNRKNLRDRVIWSMISDINNRTTD